MALAVTAGTYLGLNSQFSPIYPLLSAVTLLILAWFGRRSLWGSLMLSAALAALAAFTALLPMNNPAQSGIAARMRGPSEFMVLRGMVAYQPVYYEGRPPRAYFDLDVQEIRRATEWVPISDRVWLRLRNSDDLPPLKYGDLLEIGGVLVRRDKSQPGYTANKALTFNAEGGDGRIVSRGHGFPLISLCLNLRLAAARVLTVGIEEYPQQSGLLKALLLGYRESLDSEIYDRFTVTGTVHILAISGLHVGLIAGFILLLMRWVGIPRTRWYLLLIPLLVLYTVGTGLRASAVRACLMAIIYWLAPPLKRRPDALCSIALAAIIILFASPMQLLDPGFQFSFAIVTGIILMLPVLNRWGLHFTESDPLRIEPEPKYMYWLRLGVRKFYFLVAITLTAWLVSLPLVIYYGNLFSPIALLANLFVVPLITVVVGLGALTMLLGGFVLQVAAVLNNLNRILLTILINFIGEIAAIPAGHIYIQSPSIWFIPVYYLLVWGAFASRRFYSRALLMLAAGLLVAGHICVQASRGGRFEARAADGCVVSLLEMRGGGDVLVNTGPFYFHNELRRWLRNRGVNRLARLILTQVDRDHAGGLVDLLSKLEVDEVWIPDYDSRSDLMSTLEDLEARGEIHLRRLVAGDPLGLSEGFEIEFFNPLPSVNYRSGAQAAGIFRLARGHRALMIAGSSRIDPRIFGQAKDVAAPIWVLDEYRLSEHVERMIQMYAPETIVFGGEHKPAQPGWMLRQQGPFVYSFQQVE